MKNFLTKKWFAPLFLFLYTAIFSLFLVHEITPQLKKAFPVITQEASHFLPITIQNGEIVQPQDTIISKVYSDDNGENFNVVLDTRTDTFDINTLPDEGIYVSKKCIYVVSSKERKVKCMDSTQTQEPLVITEETVKNLMDMINKYIGTFMMIFLTVVLFICLYLVILFYTVIMHWIIALSFKAKFGQTLFINTFVYMICNLLELLTPIDIGFWAKVILFICVNLLICKSTKETKKTENSF